MDLILIVKGGYIIGLIFKGLNKCKFTILKAMIKVEVQLQLKWVWSQGVWQQQEDDAGKTGMVWELRVGVGSEKSDVKS